MHYDARCVIHLLCFTVAGLHVRDRGDRRGGWCTQKGESSADGLLVAWLLWPSGPLSSDCHSWGLRYRFLRRSHSSKLTPPTKHCLPRPTSHDAICPDRWKDRGLKPTYIFFHWFVLFFLGLPWLIHQSFSASLIHFVSLSSPPLLPYYLFLPGLCLHLIHLFCFQCAIHICLFNIPSPTPSTLCPGVHVHLFGSLPPWRE